MTTLAQRCFNENLRLIGKDPSGRPKDPIAWNVNQGLLDLATQVAALQAELQTAQGQIRAIAIALSNR